MVTMQSWHALSLVVAMTWTVTAGAGTNPANLPELTRNATADDPLTVQSKSKYCDWDRALGPVCVYNTTTQVSASGAAWAMPEFTALCSPLGTGVGGVGGV